MADFKRTSFLKNAKSLNGGQFLGLNSLPSVPASKKDRAYVIEQMFDERPDLLAYSLYGNSNYFWVFALRNPDIIKDPIRDFKAGTAIILPGEDTVNGL